MDYTRSVKPSTIMSITKYNHHKVTEKYPFLIPPANGVSCIPEHPPSAYPTSPYRGPPMEIITSIRQQNRGKTNGLFVDSVNICICLANKDDASIHKGLRLLFRRIFNGHIDACMEPYLTNTYLFCLYKDEMDPSKL